MAIYTIFFTPSGDLELPKDRAFARWKLPLTPDKGAVLVARICFPTDFLESLKELPDLPEKKKPLLLNAAPPGQAMEIGIFYSREHPSTLEDSFLRIGTPFVFSELSSGEYLSVLGRVAPFDTQRIPQFEQWGATTKPLDKTMIPKPGECLDGLGALLGNSPGDGDVFEVIEITGLSLKNTDHKQ